MPVEQLAQERGKLVGQLGRRVGAENPDTPPDQRDRRHPTYLAVTVGSPRSRISRRGLPTGLPHARPRP